MWGLESIVKDLQSELIRGSLAEVIWKLWSNKDKIYPSAYEKGYPGYPGIPRWTENGGIPRRT